MFDRHEARDGRKGHDLPHRDAAGDAPLADRPLADREVPLPGTTSGSDMALHQWLDGDLSEADARRVDGTQVEFWSRIAAETDRRRRVTAPAGLSAQIMGALPDRVVADRAVSASAPLHAVAEQAREGGLQAGTVALIGAGMFAAGVMVGKTLL